eukprot:COSAG02_NODE_5837_length_4000_cov_5.018457_6_plen_75_part_00
MYVWFLVRCSYASGNVPIPLTNLRVQEDWRYAEQRELLGRHFWWVSWVSVFMAQSTFMFAGCLSLYPVRLCSAC